MIDLHKLIEFNELLHQFQQVKRIILVTGEDRLENDLEHSAQLALCAWYLIEHHKLKLNSNKVIKYALAHDLVEAYAGDTYFFARDPKEKQKLSSKSEKEEKARLKIKKNFPQFKELHSTILNYEKRLDDESKFVYALDKVLPVINIYMDNGRSWQEDNVTLEMLRSKKEKVKVSKEIAVLWDELVALLESQEFELFNKKKGEQ